jgi:hypothetical protein
MAMQAAATEKHVFMSNIYSASSRGGFLIVAACLIAELILHMV